MSSSFSSTPHAPRANRLNKFAAAPLPSERSQTAPAFQPFTSTQKKNVTIQPFRRATKRRQLPVCVPRLDLSLFNQPDEQMAPIEILNTASTCCQSWGQNHPGKSLAQVTAVAPFSPSISSQIAVEKVAHLELAEVKMMSNERARSSKTFEQMNHPHTTCTVTDFRVPIPAASLNKHLRFEARVATQNGRDVHRELCGFYFLVDSSLTIYEFRQFGKRSNAIPLIQRGVYYHHRTAQQYTIQHITKGVTLHFESKNHPCLPSSLAKHKLLHIRIARVDETVKQRLLCEGCDPVQCREVEKFLSAPLPLISLEEDNMLFTLQAMVRSRLCGRACKTMVGLGRHLSTGVMLDERTVSFLHLQLSLRKYHVSLTTEDMQQFWQLLSKTGMYSQESQGVYIDCCLQALTGALSEDRLGLIRQVFVKLDSRRSGHIDVDQLKKIYIMKDGEAGSLWLEMVNIFELNGNKNTSISFADFENFYHGLSVETSSNSIFYNLMKTHWGV